MKPSAIRWHERQAAAWFAAYKSGEDPLFRFYGHEDFPGWREGFDAGLRLDNAPPNGGHGLTGWLAGRIWKGAA